MSSKVVVIVAPEGREITLEHDLMVLGVSGYTAWNVRGHGIHGTRPSQWLPANVRIEVVVDAELATRILDRIATAHPRSTGVFAYAIDAQVMPPPPAT